MNEHLFLGDSTYPHTKSAWQIRRELIKEKFDQFFDFPTEDRSQVTSVSCKLFVDYVLQESADRIDQLERELADAKNVHARYEYVRKLNVRQFQEIYLMNLHGDQPFDERIDSLINASI